MKEAVRECARERRLEPPQLGRFAPCFAQLRARSAWRRIGPKQGRVRTQEAAAGAGADRRSSPLRSLLPSAGSSEAPGAAGSLHESITHECLKSLLAFRKPAVAVASRRPARTDGPKVKLRGALGRLGYLCAEGGTWNGKVCGGG